MSFVTGGDVVYLKEPTLLVDPWVVPGGTVFVELPPGLFGDIGDSVIGFFSEGVVLAGYLTTPEGVSGFFYEEALVAAISPPTPVMGIIRAIPDILGYIAGEVTISGLLSISKGSSVAGATSAQSTVAGMIGIIDNELSGEFSEDQGFNGSMSRTRSVVGEIT